MKRIDERFPRKERLQGKRNFDRVYKDGAVYRTQHIVLFCLRDNVEGRKAAFVTSKRLGKAVRRNRIRRRLREAYRRFRAGLPERVHLVFVARSGVAELEWEGLLGEMGTVLLRAGLKKS
ncbi:MAG: ribonuclease P protein component [Candidatus Eiseniibacteriota bacterium]|nr:MAG: ribonuclease P protein component [Candidatus Eisenbacteria bacterium]